MTVAPESPPERFYVISGCSGSGKSTLLGELAERGHDVVPEPGREIVQEQLATGGRALPWEDAAAFVERVVALAIREFERRAGEGRLAFFDRSLVDAANSFGLRGLPLPAKVATAVADHRYAEVAFMSPPWRELFANDDERRHSFEDAAAEYESLLHAYRGYGHRILLLPRGTPKERADFVEGRVAEHERARGAR